MINSNWWHAEEAVTLDYEDRGLRVDREEGGIPGGEMCCFVLSVGMKRSGETLNGSNVHVYRSCKLYVHSELPRLNTTQVSRNGRKYV